MLSVRFSLDHVFIVMHAIYFAVLKGLDLSCRTKTNDHCMALHIGDTAYFNTSLQSGYIPNIDFGYVDLKK